MNDSDKKVMLYISLTIGLVVFVAACYFIYLTYGTQIRRAFGLAESNISETELLTTEINTMRIEAPSPAEVLGNTNSNK